MAKGKSMLLVKYPKTLQTGHFVKRYKRFFMDVLLENGEITTVHCCNSGSMRSCLEPESRVYTLASDNPARKLSHTLELMELSDGLACLNTLRANQFVANLLGLAIAPGSRFLPSFLGRELLEEDLAAFDSIRAEATFASGCRLDFLLQQQNDLAKRAWLEVKSVSLRLDSRTVAFPDAVTTRGQKHLKELMTALEKGEGAWLFFVVMRGMACSPESLARGFRAAGEIDPAYDRLLAKAVAAGLKVRLVVPELTLAGLGIRGYFPLWG